MLLIIMHNNEKYLKEICSIIKKEKIPDVKIIEKKGLGSSFSGESNYVFSLARGRLLPEYDKALISVVKDKDSLNHILNLIDQDPTIRLLNLDNKGFICTIPFEKITGLEIERHPRAGRKGKAQA